ncbi:aspartyl-phosphate phosphatase Spo0E family protein [Bacillus sp. EB600]|uniref:aspartyl-phosphate phosphatase Spo0E family protein n=1 Tax=Bacillus sp. EB600 TaxID=2806345 RepID=UPI00210D997A|nr:aspartyl-phosphate phosphatase Spo0E family protein [Bacillus sp. EB600]
MILIAKETGLNSDDTLRYSQKLDQLITMFQTKRKTNHIQSLMKIPVKSQDQI